MTIRVAINGFGRIGRAAFRTITTRQAQGKTELEVVAINDLTNNDMLAHLLKYDSVHGRFDAEVGLEDSHMIVNGKKVWLGNERDPKKLPWKEMNIDVVLESTGVFRSRSTAAFHLEAGAKKVVISAPSKGEAADATICFGVNNTIFKKENCVISTASCTTNCLAPVAKVLNDTFGIENAMMTTVHSYTNDQRILDLPHSDKRRARAAALSMIPTSTGATSALSLILPELTGKINGMAIRVPTPDVSLVDLVVQLKKSATAEEVNAALEAASKDQYKGILGYTEEELVSTDYIGSLESSIIDADSTMMQGDKLLKLLVWYDNEWGFTQRAVDLLEFVSQ